MADFQTFVQTELPKRPFVNGDGAPGQALVRSSDPTHPLELVWADISGGGGSPTPAFSLEAGEDLLKGTPLKVVSNKVYAADQLSDPNVVGLAGADTSLGFSCPISVSGTLTLSGLTAGSPYYVGTGAITNASPVSGFLIRIGMAVTASVLLVNIEEPIFLA